MGGKKRVGKYPLEFRRAAVARMKESEHITKLAEELGVERSILYKWRNQLEPGMLAEKRRTGPKAAAEVRARAWEREVDRLKRALGEKTLEVDFFKGALQRIEARRRSSSDAGEPTSTAKSGK